MRTTPTFSLLALLLAGCVPLDAGSNADALILGDDLTGIGPHVELPEVVAGRDFCTKLTLPGIASSAIAIRPGQRIASFVSWDATRGCFAGRLRAPGAYRVEILAAGARQLAHLVAQPPAAPADEARDYSGLGPHAAGRTDRTIVFTAPIAGATPTGSATSTALVVHYPSATGGTNAPSASGAFPMLVLAHGTGFHAYDYDELGARLASWGIVFAIPELVTSMYSVAPRAAYIHETVVHLRAAGASVDDLFAGHIGDGLAIAGHSWGGAAADLAMQEGEASLYVMLDPVSLIHNPAQAQNEYGVLGGTGPYVHPVATLVLDAGSSLAFNIAAAAHAGLHRGPAIHVSLGSAAHENFLDHDAPQNTMFPLALTQAVHAAAAHYIVAAVARYVHGDVGAGGPLFASAGLASYPYPITMAARRPTATDIVIDDFADASVSTSSTPGIVTITGATAALTRPLAADSSATVYPGGVAFFAQPAFQQLRLALTGTAQVSFDLATPLDVRDQRVVAVDLARRGGSALAVRIGLASASTTQWFVVANSLSGGEAPGTAVVPLSSFPAVDLSAVRRVLVEIAGPATVTLDDVRFAR